MLVLLGIGVAASRRMHGLRDYYAADKGLGYWAVAFSARATGESAWLLLGLTGMGAALGVRGFWVVLGEVLGVVGAWVLMSRRFHRLTTRYDSITVPDYLESRFRQGPGTSRSLRVFSAIALTVFVTIYVSAQIDATGTAFESFLGMDWMAGALLGFAVVMIYATSGGFLAVVWSDIFQGVLMFVGLVCLPIVGLVAIGGMDTMVDKLAATDPSLLMLTGPEGWTGLTMMSTLGLALIGLGFLGSPQIFVRFIALRDEEEISKGTAVAFVWTLLADGGAVLTGMVGRAWLTGPGESVEAALGNGGQDVLPLLVESLLPGFLVGLFIAIVLSAIMSTVDSLLVVASSAAVRDLYQKVLRPDLTDQQLIGASRWATLGIAALALGITLVIGALVEGRTVFWFVVFGWSGIAATFCPTMILSLYWRRFTARGALWAMISGFLGVPLFKFGATALPGAGPYFAELAELPPAFLLSFTVGIIVSLLDTAGQATLQAAGIDTELDAASR
ncbi:MAG: sodium:proline symporter [Deltaproteobacteria bacterium]|nr:sodium:proline symporter [Deltaproteobacteria bacterium]HCH63313.1 sodium:proline symporter [Deltaproteobacteria bacterium]